MNWNFGRAPPGGHPSEDHGRAIKKREEGMGSAVTGVERVASSASGGAGGRYGAVEGGEEGRGTRVVVADVERAVTRRGAAAVQPVHELNGDICCCGGRLSLHVRPRDADLQHGHTLPGLAPELGNHAC